MLEVWRIVGISVASCRVSGAQQRCVQARGDCERWLYDVFGEPQPTEAPALSGAVSGALGADVLRDDPQRRITNLRYLDTPAPTPKPSATTPVMTVSASEPTLAPDVPFGVLLFDCRGVVLR